MEEEQLERVDSVTEPDLASTSSGFSSILNTEDSRSTSSSGDISIMSNSSGDIPAILVPEISATMQAEPMLSLEGSTMAVTVRQKCVGKNNKGVSYGFTTEIGRRREMEDAMAIIPGFMSSTCDQVGGCTAPGSKTSGEISPVHFFGVYDGHGGSQGFLNEQFIEVEKLEDDRDNPDFVEGIVNLFLSQAPDEITCIEQALEETPLDLVELNRCIYKFKGSIVSIGAERVDAEIVKMLACLREDAIDIGGVRAALSRVKEEFSMLKYKLDAYIGLLRPKDLPSESADSNSPKNEGTSTSGDKEEVGSKPSAD